MQHHTHPDPCLYIKMDDASPLPAPSPSVWVLSPLQVNLLMYFEVSLHSEAFTTLSTAVRLQPTVEALVSLTVVLPRKPLAADIAAKWPFARVHTLVRLQPCLLGERFAAFEAPIRFKGLVGGLVLFQLRQSGETPVANRADEEFLICSPYIHQSLCSQVVSTEDMISYVWCCCICCRPLCMRED